MPVKCARGMFPGGHAGDGMVVWDGCFQESEVNAGNTVVYLPVVYMLARVCDITMKVIASVEKYENAGMKFSTVPAFALAESRASDACCLFLLPHRLEFSLFSSPRKFRASCAFWIRSGIAHVANAQPRPTSCDSCRSRELPAGRRPCSLAVMRAS